MFPIAKTAMHHVPALPLTAIRYGAASVLLLALLAAVEGRGGAALRRRLRAGARAGDARLRRVQPPQLRRSRPDQAPERGARRRDDALRDHAGPAPPRRRTACARPVVAAMRRRLPRRRGGHHEGPSGQRAPRRRRGRRGARPRRRDLLGPLHDRRDGLPDWSPLRFTALTAAAGTLSILLVTAVAALAGWTRLPSGADLGATAPEIAYVILVGALVGGPRLERGGAARSARRTPCSSTTSCRRRPSSSRSAGGYGASAWELGGAVVAVAALVGRQRAGPARALTAGGASPAGPARAGGYRPWRCPSSAWTAPSPRPPTSRRRSTRSRRASPRASASRRCWAPRAPARR